MFPDSVSGNDAADFGGSDTETRAGVIGNGQYFDGGIDQLLVPNEGDYDFINSLSVSLWFMAEDFTVDFQSVVTKGRSWGVQGLFQLIFPDQIAVVTDGPGPLAGPAVNDAAWHHIVFNKTVANGYEVFVDGQPADGGLGPIYTGAIIPGDFEVMIGGNSESAGREWFGDIDEVRVGAPTRSADWVWATYQNSASNALFNCFEFQSGSLPVSQLANLPVSEILGTSAVANVQFGGSNLYWDLLVYWGTSDGGTNPAAWANSATVLSATNQSLTNVSSRLDGLLPSNTYYYTWRITNCFGDVWAAPSESFLSVFPTGMGRPTLSIVTPDQTLFERSHTTIGGLHNKHVLGTLSWSNLTTGVGGTSAAGSPWTSPLIPIATGTNTIAVSGTNLLGEVAADTTTVISVSSVYRMLLTPCGYDRDQTLTNFPMLVVLGTNVTGHAFSTNGDELRFRLTNTMEELVYEIESWDPNGSAYVWVRVPELSSTTAIHAYWGHLGLSQPAYTTNGAVWDANYLNVWHLNDLDDATAND
ncbi:MAG: DUF2341 domain-containing protein, partial [Verrucomicrobiota bacterium]